MQAALSSLPIDAHLDSILTGLQACPSLILTATPGAGKSTRLPPELLRVVGGKIAVLEPRRIAAIAAAMRASTERGWKLGQEIGYQVRGDSCLGSSTRLIYMTEALLLRRMVDDPELEEFDLVIIDEFHERSLNQDLLMGALRELQELGRELKVLVMSATLDPRPLLEYWPQSQHLDIPGQVYPLDLRYIPQPQRLRTDREFYDRTTEAVLAACRESVGNVLVFLPGTGEIRKLKQALEQSNIPREILGLHGSLSLDEQRKVLEPGSGLRVILATNVAEASLTVPGVSWVIDTGLVKVTDFNWSSGFSRLGLNRVSKFSARQRAGRAARVQAGVCVRLWSAAEEAGFQEQSPPEILRSDLSSALLWLAYLGVTDFKSFSWFEAPPDPLLSRALLWLQNLGALDESRRLTSFGRELLEYPLSPRLASLLILSERQSLKSFGAHIASLLEEKDFVQDSVSHSGLECDILHRLELLAEFAKGKRSSEIISSRAQRILQTAALLGSQSMAKHPPPADHADEIKEWILRTHPDRLCRRRGQQPRALMQGGRGVLLDPRSQVRESEFFVALQGMDFPGQAETRISLATGFDKEFILHHLQDRIESQQLIEFDESKGQFYSKKWRAFGGLALEEPSFAPVEPDERARLWPEVLLRRWDKLLKENDSLARWVSRWGFFEHWQTQTDSPLSHARLTHFLELASYGKQSWRDICNQDLVVLLETTLDPNELQEFHRQVPSHFEAPSGSHFEIQYEAKDKAYVEVRLQELFGLMQSPLLLAGRLPLTFRLLAPNFRPVQVTSDLENFWKTGYPEVRKELRARYPKHSWPEDPYTARPEAKGRRRR